MSTSSANHGGATNAYIGRMYGSFAVDRRTGDLELISAVAIDCGPFRRDERPLDAERSAELLTADA